MQGVPNSGVDVGAYCSQVLLYADDVVLFTETAADMQSQLGALKEITDLKHLTVNVQETQILSSRSGGCSWHFAGRGIEIVLLASKQA